MDNHPSKSGSFDARFTTEDVLAVAGINESTLQNWLARGELRLEQQNPGRGKPRQYTPYEVARICFLKKLVDLAFPVVPAFKITAALQRLWEEAPGGHEAYADEPNLLSWLLVAPLDVWERRKRLARFPLDHSVVRAEDYVGIWAVENLKSSDRGSIRDALAFFAGAPIIIVNMGLLLKETLSLLERRL